MRTFLLSFVLAVTTITGSFAQEARNNAVTTVIERQIEAFKLDDFDTAFTFASPNIQQMFGSPDRFGVMVRQGFPMVWRPSDVQFLDQAQRNGIVWQRVRIRDGQGAFHELGYQMVQDPSGKWRINGVRFLEPSDLGV